MTDKERILTYIIQRFYPKYIIGLDNRREIFDKCKASSIRKGDLVIAISSGLHSFSIGYVENLLSESEMLIREIGTNRTCKIGNEMFYKIDIEKLDKNELLEGKQYDLYQSIKKVCNKNYYINNKCLYLYYVNFLKDNIVEVCMREKWHEYNKDNPIKFIFKNKSKITLKEITEAMKRDLEIK